MNRLISGQPLAMLLAIALAVLTWLPAMAASPSPSAGAVGGDPRSSGKGPCFVGDPLSAIRLVLGIGLVSLVVTYLYIRLTAGRTRS